MDDPNIIVLMSSTMLLVDMMHNVFIVAYNELNMFQNKQHYKSTTNIGIKVCYFMDNIPWILDYAWFEFVVWWYGSLGEAP
jgi:hypothetical protein